MSTATSNEPTHPKAGGEPTGGLQHTIIVGVGLALLAAIAAAIVACDIAVGAVADREDD